MEKYRYEALRPGYKDIRLIRLQPGLQGTDIEIQILLVPLESEPEYEALSYTWGCSDRTHSVLVQESEGVPTREPSHFELSNPRIETRKRTSLGIAQNLFIALQNLRYLDKPRVLWIDAMCINQDDLKERSTEVLEMGSIYRNAHEVIVWLGPSGENSDLALKTLKQIAESITHYPDKGSLSSHPGGFSELLEDNTVSVQSHSNSFIAIENLLKREWWSRLWVFQEVVSASSASLVIGRDVINWNLAVVGLHWIFVYRDYLDRHIEFLNLGEISNDRVREFMDSGCYPRRYALLSLLRQTSDLLCSDPRDRLFAIRSLAYDTQAKVITPDYSLSLHEVYLNFAKAWLSRVGNANILAFCHLSDIPTDSGLPSWVPDWTSIPLRVRFGQSAGASRAFPTFDEGDRLIIHGILLGNLSYVTTSVASLVTEAEVRELCKSWRELLDEKGGNVRGSSSHESFLELIVAGSISEIRPSVAQNFPSLDQIERFLVEPESLDESCKFLISDYIRETVVKRVLFQIAETNLGIGPRSATLGDCVVVILGCVFPLILRPDSTSREAIFRVVGPCYVPGFMNSQALLGPLPHGWSVRQESLGGPEHQLFTNGSIRTQKDPRIPPLTSTWRYIYGKEGKEVESKKLQDMEGQWFENETTGKGSDYDPRLTPEFLKGRGVAIEELILV